jgi:acetyl esterase/lipase
VQYVHGGGYVIGSLDSYLKLTGHCAGTFPEAGEALDRIGQWLRPRLGLSG